MEQRNITVIIPCYNRSDLVRSLLSSLENCYSELTEMMCSIVVINDSPDNSELTAVLNSASVLKQLPSTVIANERTIGFVESANKGLRTALASRSDALLLNEDTVIHPGAIRELSRVAYADSMIGFVSPRSNNATICTFPQRESPVLLSSTEAYVEYAALAHHLPDFQYVPAAVGFCLYIKNEILAEFGVFDPVFSPGYHEENDLIMRANRCGFRAAIANRAYVYHHGRASFNTRPSNTRPSQSAPDRNVRVLESRYPEYMRSIDYYFAGARYKAETLLPALLPDRHGRLNVVFDLCDMGPNHCGTFEVAKKILTHAAACWSDRFRVHAVTGREAQNFHRLSDIPNLNVIQPENRMPFAAAVYVGQPAHVYSLTRMGSLSPINIFVMQDTIAYDCQNLNTRELPDTWAYVFAHADAVIYISEFTKAQCRTRFRIRPGLHEAVIHHSVNPHDYRPKTPNPQAGSYILIIGTKFEHKWIGPTARKLASALPHEKFVLIGRTGEFPRNVECHPSGYFTDDQIDGMYDRAKAVIYPSFYEGFGLPVVKALAHKKPVFARSIAVIRELQPRLSGNGNLHLYSTTEELVHQLKRGVPAWQQESEPELPVYGWSENACEVRRVIEAALDKFSFEDTLIPRLDALRTFFPVADQIEEIYASWSWRLTAPVRLVGSWYLRAKDAGWRLPNLPLPPNARQKKRLDNA